jgi:recombinational DNA repair protein (RecF pathway)
MPTLKDNAQVLSVIEQGNTSLVLVLLGEQLGQIHVHAKGGRRWPKKGFEGGMDLLARGQIVVYPRPGEMLWLLKEWSEDARPKLGQSVPLLYAGSFLSELVQALTRPTAGQHPEPAAKGNSAAPHAQLYQLLAAAAEALAAGAAPGAVILAFAVRAFEQEGLLPALDRCDDCGRDLKRTAAAAWLSSAGLYCPACAAKEAERRNGVKLMPEALRALQQVRKTRLAASLSAAAAEQLARALVVLTYAALEQDPRTLPAAVRLVKALSRKQKAESRRP